MTNQNNILTEEEIREAINELCSKWEIQEKSVEIEKHVRAVKDYFELRPNELKHLTDREFRKSFIKRIYLHSNALSQWVEKNEEVKNLQSLNTSLEQERNELLEKNKQLEVKLEEKDDRIEELEESVELERKNHLEFVDVSEVWHDKKVSDITLQKDADLAKVHQQVKELEDILLVKNSQIKNLKESKNWSTYKFKQMGSKFNLVKNKIQEKFQAFIVHKDK